MSYGRLLELAVPETIVVLATLVGLLVDLTALRGLDLRLRLRIGAMVAGGGCLLAILWMLAMPAAGDAFAGMLVVDPLTRLVKGGILVLALMAIFLTLESDFTTHVGEYYALLLLATVGMMLLASSSDILMIFLALELTSLSLYILTAFNKASVTSTEAALKYFLFGGVAAAFTLFGLSLLYGIAGSTNLADIARVAGERAIRVVTNANGLTTRTIDPLLIAAIVMTVIGFGFKVAVVPFHLWAPDAYQGAPIPARRLHRVGIETRQLLRVRPGDARRLCRRRRQRGLARLAAGLGCGAGTFGRRLDALGQSRRHRPDERPALARLLRHRPLRLHVAGRHDPRPGWVAALLYYAFTYGLTAIGAFAVVAVVQGGAPGERLNDFAGLVRRAPVVSACMLVFLLSLAGIPPLAGFFGKFYLFTAVLRGGTRLSDTLWLIILAIGMSTVSLYYYLQVLKQIFVVEGPPAPAPRPVPPSTQVLLVLLATAVVFFGCAPGPLLSPLLTAARAAW